jgi:hypothetical protein
VSGATEGSYVVSDEDYATRLRVVVTALNAVGAGSKYSLATTAVGFKPVATGVPTVTGVAQPGQTLTAEHGTWDNSPASYSYRWQRCSGSPTVCSNVSGATEGSYVVSDEDYATRLRVVVTALNAVGAGSKYSVPTAAVTEYIGCDC